MADRNDDVGKLHAETRQVNQGNRDLRTGQNAAHINNAVGAVDDGVVANLSGIFGNSLHVALGGNDEAHHIHRQRADGSVESADQDRVAREQESDKDDQRDENDEVIADLDGGFLIRSLDSVANRNQMDGKECAQIVQQRRHNRGFGNLNVVYADELRHDKCGCAHDRRHDLTACGRNCFDGGRPFVGISGFFHGWDGKYTGGDDVADGASGDHAKQGRSDDGYLA